MKIGKFKVFDDVDRAAEKVVKAGLSTGHASTCMQLTEELLDQFEQLRKRLHGAELVAQAAKEVIHERYSNEACCSLEDAVQAWESP